jgi:O-antigen/teichoic acid export membrane protein
MSARLERLLPRRARMAVAAVCARREVSGALVINLGGGIVVQLLLLVSGVVLARTLGPANRGNMALLTLVSGVAWQLGGLGIPFALTYATARAPETAFPSFRSLRQPIAIQAVGAAVVAAIVLYFLTAHRPDYVRLGAAMTSVAIIAAVYTRCALGVIQGLRHFVSLNILRALPTALFAFVAAGLWISGEHAFLPYAICWALSQIVVAPVAVIAANRAARKVTLPGAETVSRGEMLRFGRKSLFGGSPPVETYRLDQSVVAIFLAPAALGYYVAALAFTNLPRFVAQSFALVSTPVIAGRKNHRAAIRTMWKFCLIAIPCYLLPVIVLFVGAPFLVKFFFGADFARAGGISRILLIATALFCARRVMADAARGAGYPAIGSIAEAVAFVAVFPLFAIFVPSYGLDGVAWSLVGSSTIALVILVAGVLRLTGNGRVPESWTNIHGAVVAKPRPGIATGARG